MAEVDLKLMRAAVVLAEELNFSRAADKLHISQSGLSKQISTLEELLGYQLFVREGRGVAVTPAGERFVAEARLALEHQERAVQLSREAHRSTELVLHVGKSPYTDPYLLTKLLSLRLPLFPTLRIHLTTRFASELSHDLLNGLLDLAFLTALPSTPRLTSVAVANQPFYIVMLEEDALARYREIVGQQLETSSCILFERHVHPYMYDSLLRLARPASKTGTSLHHVMTAEDASHLIRRGLGVAVLSQAGAWRVARNGITIRPLVIPELRLETRLATRSDSQSRAVSDFVRGFVTSLGGRAGRKQLHLGLAGQ